MGRIRFAIRLFAHIFTILYSVLSVMFGTFPLPGKDVNMEQDPLVFWSVVIAVFVAALVCIARLIKEKAVIKESEGI